MFSALAETNLLEFVNKLKSKSLIYRTVPMLRLKYYYGTEI